MGFLFYPKKELECVVERGYTRAVVGFRNEEALMRWLIAIVVVVVAVIGFLSWQNLTVPETTGLTNGRLHPCPKTLNCVCCCHDGTDHYIAPLPLSSAQTLDQIQSFLFQHYNTEVIQKTPDYLHVVVTTPIFHFKDDLEFSVNRQRKVILVRSASRLGFADGGINRARIEAIRTFLATEQK